MQIQKRNIVTSIVLSIVTCGIYEIIWTIFAVRDAIKIKDSSDDGVLESVLAVLPFTSNVGFFLAERKFSDGCKMHNINHKDNDIAYLIIGFNPAMSIVNTALLQNELNKIADTYNRSQPSYGNQPPYGNVQQPPYGNVQQPPYGNDQQPPYGNDQQPPYGNDQQPSYGNDQQPPYDDAQSPYGNDQQPPYGAQPPYGNDQQHPYGAQPPYGNA